MYDEYDDDGLDELNVSMEELSSLLRMLMESLPKERIIHDDQQVLSFEDLEIGGMYEQHYAGGGTILLQIASEPYLTEHGWKVDYWYEYTWLRQIGDAHLSDMSIIPYEGGDGTPVTI